MEGKAQLNPASMIDLKAELFRKQEEFKKQKAENAGAAYVRARTVSDKVKPDIWSKKNAGVLKRAQQDLEDKAEEEDVHQKSRRALEAKARLYDKMASSKDIPEEDGSGAYLVDFQKKVIDTIIEKRRQQQEKEEEEEDLKTEVPPPETPDEEWVDYVDSFGRSRRCLRKDLPDLEKQNQRMAQPVKEEEEEEEEPQLLSEDMRRERMRRQWEKEEEEALGKPAGPVHYSNVQYNEIRTHGVGYFQFAKDSDTRTEQMDLLHTLREKTVTERARVERVKEKRKAMLDARLAKVRRRQRLKAGLPEEEPEEDVGPRLEEQWREGEGDKEGEKAATPEEPEPLTRDDSWRRKAPEREWDKGKPKPAAWSEEKYLESRREERVSEFAPPSIYSDSTTPTPQSGPRNEPQGWGRGRGVPEEGVGVSQGNPLLLGNQTRLTWQSWSLPLSTRSDCRAAMEANQLLFPWKLTLRCRQ